MTSRYSRVFPESSLLGLALGVPIGLALGLLAAPRRGRDTRAAIRARALAMGYMSPQLDSPTDLSIGAPTVPASEHLTAKLGEIAEMHAGTELPSLGARS